eukprot:8984126-Ditylum_brightwellii.AAC.1
MSKEGVTQGDPLAIILYALAGHPVAIFPSQRSPSWWPIPEGYRYLGRFLGLTELAKQSVEEKVDNLVTSINTFSSIMPNNPQAAFTGYACSLQFEWAYIHRTIEVEER